MIFAWRRGKFLVRTVEDAGPYRIEGFLYPGAATLKKALLGESSRGAGERGLRNDVVLRTNDVTLRANDVALCVMMFA